MSTIADDLLNSANLLSHITQVPRLTARLRSHAALIEKIEAEMREHYDMLAAHCWADALKTGELK